MFEHCVYRDAITESTSFEKPLLWKDTIDTEGETEEKAAVTEEKSIAKMSTEDAARISTGKKKLGEKAKKVLQEEKMRKKLEADMNNEFVLIKKDSNKKVRLRAAARQEMMSVTVGNSDTIFFDLTLSCFVSALLFVGCGSNLCGSCTQLLAKTRLQRNVLDYACQKNFTTSVKQRVIHRFSTDLLSPHSPLYTRNLCMSVSI